MTQVEGSDTSCGPRCPSTDDDTQPYCTVSTRIGAIFLVYWLASPPSAAAPPSFTAGHLESRGRVAQQRSAHRKSSSIANKGMQ